MRILRVPMILLLLASPLAASFAEEPGSSKTASETEYVEVTATRIPEDPAKVPASITIVTGADLRNRGARDLRSALALVAGVDIAPGGDGGPFASIPEFWGLKEFDAFLLVVDGVPWGGAFNPDLASIDLTGVERIEIQRGAAPVMFGATSFVGVIHVIHAQPGSVAPIASGSAGSYGSGSGAVLTALPKLGGLASSLTVNAERLGSRDDRTEASKGHLLWQGLADGSWGRLRLGFDGTWLRQDPASPHPREGTVLSPSVPLDANHNPRDAQVNERRLQIDASYERSLKVGSWTTTVSFSRAAQSVLRGFLSDVSETAPNAAGFRQSVHLTDAYFDSHFVFVPSSKVSLVTGVDHLHGRGGGLGGDFTYFVRLNGSAAPSGDDLDDDARVRITDRREFSGVYGQVEWTPLQRWRFDLGARLNRTTERRSKSDTPLTGGPRETGDDHDSILRGSGVAGVTFTAWARDADALRLYAAYRNSFKPAAIDFGIDSESEILDPETAASVEAGLKSRLLHERLMIDVSAFQMTFDNLVVSQNSGGLPVLVNAGNERFRGFELEASAALEHDLSWRTAYSLHDARFRDSVQDFGGVSTQLAGKRLEMSPRDMAATGLIYAPAKGWLGSLQVNWVGARWLNKRNTALARDYATWSAGGGYRMDKWELRLDARNINNQRPPVAESELGDAQYYRLAARSFEVSARYQF